MGIRPEQIRLNARGEVSMGAEVILVEPMGAYYLVSVRIGTNEIKVL